MRRPEARGPPLRFSLDRPKGSACKRFHSFAPSRYNCSQPTFRKGLPDRLLQCACHRRMHSGRLPKTRKSASQTKHQDTRSSDNIFTQLLNASINGISHSTCRLSSFNARKVTNWQAVQVRSTCTLLIRHPSLPAHVSIYRVLKQFSK